MNVTALNSNEISRSLNDYWKKNRLNTSCQIDEPTRRMPPYAWRLAQLRPNYQFDNFFLI